VLGVPRHPEDVQEAAVEVAPAAKCKHYFWRV
jgi:hypothetical protein